MRTQLLLLLVIALSSCDDRLVNTDNRDLSPQGWELEDITTFKITPLDTTQQYNLFINLRNTHDYEYNNLWLISQLKFPQGKVITDTLQYQMAAPDGSFLGAGANGIYENKLWLKEGVRFRESGTYQLALKHAMRKTGKVKGDAKLKGVLNVGYSIEKQFENGSN